MFVSTNWAVECLCGIMDGGSGRVDCAHIVLEVEACFRGDHIMFKLKPELDFVTIGSRVALVLPESAGEDGAAHLVDS